MSGPSTPKFTVLIFLFLLLGTRIQAQENKVAALKAELAAHPEIDTTRLRLIGRIAQGSQRQNADSALHYARLGRRLIPLAGPGTEKYHFEFANLIANGLLLKGQGDSALHYNQEAVQFAREMEVDSLVAIGLLNKAITFQMTDRVPKAVETVLTAIELGRTNGNMPRILSNALNSAGIIFNRAGAQTEAVAFYSEALDIAHERGDSLLEAYLYSNIGKIWYEKEDYTQALSYFKVFFQKASEGFPTMAALAMSNMGACYSNLGQIDSAAKYTLGSHTLIVERNSPADLTTSYNNIASLELLQGDTLRAMAYMDSSITSSPSPYYQFNVLLLKGQTFAHLGRDDSALVYLERAVESARGAQAKNSEAKMSRELAAHYLKMGQARKAYTALNNSANILDSLQQVNNGLQEILANFREQNEKARLQKEIDLTQSLNAELESKWRFARWAIGISLAFGLVLVLFIRTRFQLTRALLKKKEAELGQEKKRLFWRSESLRYTTAHNQVNHHSLFFSIGKVKSLLDGKGEAALSDELDRHLGHIRKVIDVCRQEESNLEEELRLAEGLVAISEARGFRFELEHETGEELANLAFPTLGLLPLVENAVQYSATEAGGEKVVLVKIRSQNNRLHIEIQNPVGAGHAQAANKGWKSVGIDNCRERISIWAQQYEDVCQLDLEIKADLALVTLDLPLIHFDD